MKRSNRRARDFQIEPQPEKTNEIWLVTLSDLLMLLMIFFVVLFGMALQREKKETQSIPQAGLTTQRESKKNDTSARRSSFPIPGVREKSMSARLELDLIAALDREKGRQDVMIQRIADLVILTFPERIVFDPGQAKLKESGQATLYKGASFINKRPYLIVEVQGHTDDRPINTTHYPSNWELSVDRAMQVSRALITRGVNPARLSVKGFSQYAETAPNDSDENRLKNRRVEIQFSIPGHES